MAINDAVAAYTGQLASDAAQYKDAWKAAPSSGVGQFGAAAPFSGAAAGLSATSGSDFSALRNAAAEYAPNKPMRVGDADIDALPTTPTTGAPSTAPVIDEIDTTSNYTATSPYVSDVTDAGDVGRQTTRPDRLAIDDTMTQDEQYRRAWQNEANGYYGNEVAKVAAPAPAPGQTPAVDQQAPAAPVEYGVSYEGQTDASDGAATVYDKATGQVVQRFDGMALHQALGGVGSVNSDDLKKYTGWSMPPAANTGANA